MSNVRTDTFILELPLQFDSINEKKMPSRLEAARQVYNGCLRESLKRLDLLRQSKAYQTARKVPRGRARTSAFREANAAVGFREYDLHAYSVQFNHSWLGEHLDINTIQKLATRAFNSVEQYAFGKRGRPRFKGRNQMDSIEGKNNKAGIRWREDRVKWLGLELAAIIERNDPVVEHGLKSRVKYVRLVRRKINGRNRFYAQMACEGKPYQKEKNRIGKGDVGLDIGPSTIAAVGEEGAILEQFCAELEPGQEEVRRLQRKNDRQRRANNPENYNEDVTIKPGPKAWKKSNRQRKTETKLAEMKRRQAAHRKSLHGQLVNKILRMGDTIKLEKLFYRAFQKCYGRSVGMRAPGMFVMHLKRKAESAGAQVIELPTRSTRLSRTCHQCGKIEKKSLSQRWHRCSCGVIGQRDLYSAFLAMCVESGKLNVGRAVEAWPGVDTLLQVTLSEIQPTNGRCLPSSFGLSKKDQRQRWSPVESIEKSSEAGDDVPLSSMAA